MGGERAEVVLPWLDEHEGALHAPGLMDVEVAQVFRRLVAAGAVTERRAGAGLETLQELDVQRHGERPLLPRVWALRRNLTAYDATYVALAEALDCPLLTFDSRLARAPGLFVDVVVPT